MRVAIVRQYYRHDGAVERVTERALKALLERNVAVSLYARSWPRTRLELIEPVICDPFFVGDLWRDWGFARAACNRLRRSQTSLVEAHDRMLCCDVYRAADGVHAVWLEERLKHASALERFAIACSPRNRYLLHIEKRLYASPWLRAVICSSRMVKDEIRRRFAVPESKLHVVYNPVDSSSFHPGLRAGRSKILDAHRVDAGATVYLVVTGDPERCSAGAAIDALATLPAPAHLIVVGGDFQHYRRRARTLGVADRLTLAGPRADLSPYYGAADVFVQPAFYDPSPVTALEAMACGLAIVTSAKSGAAELAQEHEAGLVFPPGDTTALTAHMRTMLDAATRARFGANARRAILPLTAEATTVALVLMYRDLLAAAVPATGPTTTTRSG